MTRRRRLHAEPLTRAAFARFGDVIDCDGIAPVTINAGYARRFTDLATVDAAAEDGRAGISVFKARPRPRPVRLDLMERHPLGSQAFVPLTPDPFVIVVAPAGDGFAIDDLRAFVTRGSQGCSYARGVWHHPLIALVPQAFLVVDRLGGGINLEERPFDQHIEVDLPDCPTI